MPVVDADILAREVVAKGSSGLAAMVETFGQEILLPDGSLDRKRVAALVFADESKRRILNDITHPRITQMTMLRAEELVREGQPLACYEAALIVEKQAQEMFRPLIVVSAPEDLQVARACARDGDTEDEVRARIRAQMPLADKIAVADYVIENTGTVADLVRATDEVLASICARFAVDVARYTPLS